MLKTFSNTLLIKILLLLFLQVNLSYGQTVGSVYGFVTDSSSGEALIGANVFINKIGVGMATDVNGYYVLQDISLGTYNVTVSYVGYKVLTKKIEISNGEAIKLDLVLVELLYLLQRKLTVLLIVFPHPNQISAVL